MAAINPHRETAAAVDAAMACAAHHPVVARITRVLQRVRVEKIGVNPQIGNQALRSRIR
jgi:hypothetical protein